MDRDDLSAATCRYAGAAFALLFVGAALTLFCMAATSDVAFLFRKASFGGLRPPMGLETSTSDAWSDRPASEGFQRNRSPQLCVEKDQ